MAFYQQTGVLVFGSRLRRLSESFLGDINNVYKHHGIAFDAAWFPIFYMLSETESLSITDIAGALETSHSAASQLVAKLHEKGLLRSVPDKADARKKRVALTAKGQRLLVQIKPIWTAVKAAMNELLEESPNSRLLMAAIQETEAGLARESIFQRIEKHLP
ncbi:MarR family winged helix-turn-helix transcriptional regulator [Flavihumibacter petaseus]|uniref:Putative MarR family transcriptional regulator n=1 Tax=Flavihumibacter petaseus NBRC 106054 TaxID=1220578 RepID=A0A0E9N764_9BACT|nr:MarR family transcriptional regulator [Flavihumibacter petaseus]GAO45669.1 putative MarR family transcriptional regulator [Flavihumibacter petaseus NBRC 106054]